MLNRNDLSKQFELVVQQEIKNFQDVSYQINQTLNELRSKIDSLEKSTSTNQALLESRNNTLSIELEILRSDHNHLKHRLGIHVNDTQSLINQIERKVDGSYADTVFLSTSTQSAQNKIDELTGSVTKLEESRNAYFLSYNNCLDQSEFKTKQYLSELKKEILAIPSEADSVRTELVEKINCHKIDVEGVLKEVRVTRKEVMILQKNIEAIYSLIDDLKKSEATS